MSRTPNDTTQMQMNYSQSYIGAWTSPSYIFLGCAVRQQAYINRLLT